MERKIKEERERKKEKGDERDTLDKKQKSVKLRLTRVIENERERATKRDSYLDHFMIPMMTSYDKGRGRGHLAHSIRVSPSIWKIKKWLHSDGTTNLLTEYVFDKLFNEND